MNRMIFAIAAFTSMCTIALSAQAGGYEYQRHSGSKQQMMQSDCVAAGWMDNDRLQVWRAKNPGKQLCFENREAKHSEHYQKQPGQQWQHDRHSS